ncbi:MAG: type II toxin-antitoxin system RelB/DinJ family antitoxin [Anaerococcus obesiensis]|uniref:type II toxin-antitoxin system RelB/DinJ family antitoxin n=1 Tax=Anaerococcus TaxID=165779 RepID=UPI00030D16D2|nr:MULTISPECIES: type II toxin-antitoxin system RelB/DinJ family antitoxin [Anaerococcus]MDU0946516.1 type II toxin-antitoxin system RelB/DinJ family antitoxin [Anaerococcus vaginalis]MDU1030272.1 type II toxin-antitoxin system RelB/DinJ family antitoxin [Anaerococcus vaginalis]MDU7143335.1 type II toxin-antitoxin system RelB/DinJ family antitoxin [Anaerococcus vaginalis]
MAQINLRVDDDVKKQAELVCNDIGISLSSAINIYLKKLGREYRIPFDVSVDPFYSKKNIEYLEEKFSEYKKGNMKLIENEIIEDEN